MSVAHWLGGFDPVMIDLFVALGGRGHQQFASKVCVLWSPCYSIAMRCDARVRRCMFKVVEYYVPMPRRESYLT